MRIEEIQQLYKVVRYLGYRASIYCPQDECCSRRERMFRERGAAAANEDCVDCQIDKAKEAAK